MPLYKYLVFQLLTVELCKNATTKNVIPTFEKYERISFLIIILLLQAIPLLQMTILNLPMSVS